MTDLLWINWNSKSSSNCEGSFEIVEGCRGLRMLRYYRILLPNEGRVDIMLLEELTSQTESRSDRITDGVFYKQRTFIHLLQLVYFYFVTQRVVKKMEV